jgi:flagellar biosynthesis/type III secretory pathway M-ring protein FliF/YscJ
MLGSRSGGIWIAVLSTAGLGLLLVLSMRRRDRVESCPATEEPSMGESNVREQQLREQIDELLRTHPDTAANVIRDWIQKAA